MSAPNKTYTPHISRCGKIDQLLIASTSSGVTLEELCEVSGYQKSNIKNHIEHLRTHGLSILQKDGKYYLESPIPNEEIIPKEETSQEAQLDLTTPSEDTIIPDVVVPDVVVPDVVVPDVVVPDVVVPDVVVPDEAPTQEAPEQETIIVPPNAEKSSKKKDKKKRKR